MRSLNNLLLASLATSTALAVDVTKSPETVAKLKVAATNLDRMDILSTDADWLYDFTTDHKYTYAPGGVVNANAATFPATVGQGLTMAMLLLGPCAMLPPHYHPRGANFVVAIEGTTQTYMIAENGARTVTETLTPGKMTIFPQGSLHSMQNMGCTNATLISALNNEDSGTHNIVNGLLGCPLPIVAASLGGFAGNVSDVFENVPPVGSGAALGSAECLTKCGLAS